MLALTAEPLTTALLLALTAGVVALARHVWTVISAPSVPGPAAAKWTNWWYLSAVWNGHFETWSTQAHAQHGKIIRVGPRTYTIDDPSASKKIYAVSAPFAKAPWYETWQVPGKPNIFSARRESWHAQARRRLASLYSMTTIKSYEPFVDNCIWALLKKLDRFAETGEEFDLAWWMQCYAFDVIGEITWGKRIGFLDSGGQDPGRIIARLDWSNTFASLVGVERFLAPLLVAWRGNPGAVIDEYAATLTRMREAASADEVLSNTFYDKVLAMEEKKPEDPARYDIRQAFGVNVAAGSDTTGITLTALLFHIHKDPNVRAKLEQEVQGVLGKHTSDRLVTYDESQRMPYLQLALKEALRIHPAVALPLWREVPAPGVELAGTFFPAGTVVGTNGWVSHRNPAVFGSDAEAFRPERWDPASVSAETLSRMEQSYLPFGLGTRSCIGRWISILEINKLVPELLRRYQFELVSANMPFKNHWFAKQDGVMVRVRRVARGAW